MKDNPSLYGRFGPGVRLIILQLNTALHLVLRARLKYVLAFLAKS